MGTNPSESPKGQNLGQERIECGRKRRREESLLENRPDEATIPPPDSREHLAGGLGEGSFLPSPPFATTADTVKIHSPEANVVIYLGDERKEIQQSGFLRFVWTSGLDSPCMVCHRPFDDTDELPIRTITFQPNHTIKSDSRDITQELIAPNPLRIMNRHFECIKANNITYFPISHVWDGPVSSSKQDRTETLEATKLIYQVPVKTLNGLRKKIWPVEIWHDYLSVPQWYNQLQHRLLRTIPKIYGYPQTMVVHLDGLNEKQILDLLANLTYESFLDGLRALLNARWFKEMWLTLEYIQGNSAVILSEDFTSMLLQAPDLFDHATKGTKFYESKFGQAKFWQDAGGNLSPHSLFRYCSKLDMWKSHITCSTFSAAITFLGKLECKSHQDYFLGLSELLGFPHTSTQIAQVLAGNAFPLYLATARYALEKGDYTPLLLIPPKGEIANDEVPWLHGHSGRFSDLGTLGGCYGQATHRTIIQGGKVSPKLEQVGIIETFRYSSFEYENRTSDFLEIVQDIFKCSGLCPKALCASVDRIFPAITAMGWSKRGTASVAQAKGYDYKRVGALINQIDRLTGDVPSDGNEQVLSATLDLMDSLGLQTLQKNTTACRLKQACGEVKLYQSKGHDQMDGLARVRCKSCGRRSLFRLSMWKAPVAEEAHLFRIPGALYDLSVPEGSGLVVSGKKIIGRMIYGTPACDCHPMKEVEIQ